MSHIDDLIRQYCPDGVPKTPLGFLLAYEQPQRYLVKTTRYSDSFDIPVLTAGQTFILGYSEEHDGVYPASATNPVIIFDDFTTAFKWVDFPFKAKSSAMKLITIKPNAPVLLRYSYYAMRSIRFKPQEHSRQWIGTYSNFEIPVPPLPVQKEIVRILDSFTDLEAELEAELEARREQYVIYRSRLLTEVAHLYPNWSTIGRISSRVVSGGTPSSKNSLYYGGNIPWVRTQEVNFGTISSTSKTLTELGLKNSSATWIPANCVIVAMYGATAAKTAINSVPVTTNQACCNLQINPKIADYNFVFHWISSQYEKLRSLGEGSQSNISGRKVKEFPIPIPPVKEQRRVAATLDSFDAIVNDLSSGLPAEIAARRQQYEHYRDRLLTFKELPA